MWGLFISSNIYFRFPTHVSALLLGDSGDGVWGEPFKDLIESVGVGILESIFIYQEIKAKD